MKSDEIKATKDVISQECKNGLSEDGNLTFPGFIAMHYIGIRKSRSKFMWKILQVYGYDHQMELNEESGYLPEIPPPGMHGTTTIEFERTGLQYLTEIFHKYDKDKNGLLSEEELKDLMFPITSDELSSMILFNRSSVSFQGNYQLTLDGWLSLWMYIFTSSFGISNMENSLLLYQNLKYTILSVVYLGYPVDMLYSDCFKIIE